MYHGFRPWATATCALMAFLVGVSCEAAAARGPERRAENDLQIWFQRPATNWEKEAFPIGNGRLGGMIFGGTDRERIQLNEDTLWSGEPRDTTNPEALKALPRVRQLLFDGKPDEAVKLADQSMMGNPMRVRPYQSLGDLRLEFPGHEAAADYRRELDLSTGVVRIRYRVGQTNFTREIFASHPDQVIVVRLTTDRPGALTCFALLDREQDFLTTTRSPDKLVMEGQLDRGEGLEYQATIQALADGGQVFAPARRLEVRGANSVTLIVSAATSFGGQDAEDAAEGYLGKAAKKPYRARGSSPKLDPIDFSGTTMMACFRP